MNYLPTQLSLYFSKLKAAVWQLLIIIEHFSVEVNSNWLPLIFDKKQVK